MTYSQRKFAILAFNLALVWGAWYVSGYGVMVGRSGNLGMNCLYLTARGLYDEAELDANAGKHKVLEVDNCSAVYDFDAADR
jgi:hypothetical protein